MKRSARAGFAVLAWAAATAAAQAAPWQAEFGVGAQSLSNGLPGWRQVDAALRRIWAPRSLFELNTRTTERFDRRDSEFGAALSAPLAEDWSGSLTASVSATHRVLPRWSLAAAVQRDVGDGWVLGGGLKATHYDVDQASALSLGAERYFATPAGGEWRAAASLTQTHLAGVASSAAGRVQLDRYFGTRGRFGVLLAGGREIDNRGQGVFLVSNVRSLALVGRWPIDADWSVTGELSHDRLGSQYRRSGGRLGVQLDF